MAFLPMVAAGAGALLQAGGSILAGNQANANAKYEAKQLDAEADRKRAQASREAAQSYTDQQRLMGDQVAAAAGSGGGASDPTVLDLMSDTAQQGFLQRQTGIANGESAARGYEDQAASRRIEGKNARTAGYIGAGSSLLSGIGGGISDYRKMMKEATGGYSSVAPG